MTPSAWALGSLRITTGSTKSARIASHCCVKSERCTSKAGSKPPPSGISSARRFGCHKSTTLSARTPREREVLAEVVRGLPNKLTAADLGISEKTVKVHRHRIMTKTGVTSLAELVRLVDAGGL